jgi:hypothetical protein
VPFTNIPLLAKGAWMAITPEREEEIKNEYLKSCAVVGESIFKAICIILPEINKQSALNLEVANNAQAEQKEDTDVQNQTSFPEE